MHAKPGLRVFLKWMINRSGSVITAVIPLTLPAITSEILQYLSAAFEQPVNRYSLKRKQWREMENQEAAHKQARENTFCAIVLRTPQTGMLPSFAPKKEPVVFPKYLSLIHI